MRWGAAALGLSAVILLVACKSDDGGSGDSSGDGGDGDSVGEGGSTGDGDSAGDGDVGGDGDSTGDGDSIGDGDTGGTAGDGDATTGPAVYREPAEIVGGACDPGATPVIDACPWEPEQLYCLKSDPNVVIMATCSSAGRDQCAVMDTCERGWHACTPSDYVARGGRDVPPDFSATNRAWLAGCVRDVDGTAFKEEACSVCGTEVGYEPSVQWWCDGEVVFEGGMAGDTLGVVTSPECMRVGENTPAHSAYWSMSFSSGAPSFVMCCIDALAP